MEIDIQVKRSEVKALPISGATSCATSEVYLMDCIAGMKHYPDKFFDWAIVDPPYGIGLAGYSTSPKTMFGKPVKAHGSKFEKKEWDKSIPDRKYFDELKRVSKNQIIWGWNYFVTYLNECPSYVVWYKKTNGNFADCESAWVSEKGAARVFEWTWNGLLQQNMKDKEVRIHPTQKPVALYEWLLNNYTSEGDLILDTHLGSGSSRIAANKAGLDFVGFEIDEDYFNAQEKRWKRHVAQTRLF